MTVMAAMIKTKIKANTERCFCILNYLLVMGHWSLVISHWSLVIGHWSLVIGHW